MRVFTELEQDLLERISDGRGRNLYNLIDPYIDGVSFTINTDTNSLTINFEVQNIETSVNTLQERLQKIQSILIQVVNLVKLFEDKGYIFTFRNAQQLPESPFTFGRATTNLPSISYNFPDQRVSKLFIDLSANEIFVTPELPKFISDGFITREEVRANRQYKITQRALKITTTALIISIIALLVNTGLNFFKYSSDKKNNIENSNVCIYKKRNCELIYYKKYCNCFHNKKETFSKDSINK